MGIRSLQSFMKYKCPNGAKEINMKIEIENYKRTHDGKKPVIVIDVASIHWLVYTNEKEKLFGGRFDLYNLRTEEMFKTFIKWGAEIICVLDGPLYADKMETVFQRRTERYVKEWSIIQNINNLFIQNDSLYVPDLTTYFYNFVIIAKKYSTVIISTREGDQEVAFQANKSKALAVISHDSDFLIFDGEWEFWSGTHIDLKKCSTIHFDRKSLRNYLKLSPLQMVLFGTLSGNDFVKYDMVQNFHKNMQYGGFRFLKIADLVREINSLPPHMSKSDEQYIINLMFHHNDKTLGLQDFRKSNAFYYNIKEPIMYSSPLLEEASNSNFLYSVLLNIPCNTSLFFFDLTNSDLTPYYKIIQPMIQRQIGTIIKCNSGCSDGTNNLSQNLKPIVTKLFHNEPFKIIYEKPLFPSGNLPSLENFILRPNNKNDKFYAIKLKLFCWHVLPECENFTPEIISQLPDELVLTIATATFLVIEKEISIEEADCILFASIQDFKLKQQVQLNHIKRIDNRDARISFLFTKIYTVIGQSLQILGLENFNTLMNFDGLYYHYLRQNADKEKQVISDLKRTISNFRIYTNNV